MSWVHHSVVGHFDPSDLESVTPNHGLKPTRPLDPRRVRTLLANYDEETACCVEIRDGCVYCEWSADRSGRAHDFVERLADQELAVVIELPVGGVRHPPEAVRRYNEAIEAWRERGGGE